MCQVRTYVGWMFCAASLVTCSAVSPHTRPASETDGHDAPGSNQELLQRVRRPMSAPSPRWVNAIPDRVGDILMQKHWYRQGEVWGLAKSVPDKGQPFDEMASATFVRLVKQYNLYDRVGPLDEATRVKALRYWQAWQDPQTGRFKDPRDPKREVNEKYVVGIIGSLGGEPLYPWSTTGVRKQVETEMFLSRTKEDPDWAKGGWGVGSHTGLMAVEILDAINAGRDELIPDLEKGLQQILAHQSEQDGLWGAPAGNLMHRIGGTLKVVGRVYFRMGMAVPHSRELADALIEHSRNGDWFKYGQSSCVPRNVAEVAAYCIEVSDYRRAELLDVLDRLVNDYRSWVTPDGLTLTQRGDVDSTGLEFTTHYGLGLIGAYLHWEDCRLPNPLADSSRGRGIRYRPVLQADGSVRIIFAGDRP